MGMIAYQEEHEVVALVGVGSSPTHSPKFEDIMKSCLDCAHHKVIADPDPHDSFCADDVAVICQIKPGKIDKDSKYASDHSPFARITVGCRPYNARKETKVPNWCPLKRKSPDVLFEDNIYYRKADILAILKENENGNP